MTQDLLNRISKMRDLHGQLQDALFFYRKYHKRDSPKYRGIPYLRASESFSRTRPSAYSKLVQLFRDTVEGVGLGHLWARAAGDRGWDPEVERALEILFPLGAAGETADRDPERPAHALPHLEHAVTMIGRDLDNLEMSLSSEPELFNPTDDEIVERVINRLRRL